MTGLRMAFTAAGALLLGCQAAEPAAAQTTQQGAFVILIGSDTLAVENFTRTAARLESSLTGAAIGRIAYIAELGESGTVRELYMQAWPAGSPTDGAPAQQARVLMQDDSVLVELGAAGATQRLPSRRDALPHVNPSFALLEQMLRRARMLGGSQVGVPVFLLQGGQTMEAAVTWIGEDSATVVLAGIELRAAVDAEGRLLGGAVPTQRLTVSRVDGAHVSPVTVTPPDYSAPEGAPYTAEQVVVTTPAGHTLAGTLTLPVRSGLVPAVVTITGSGAQDRDQALPTVSGYRPFREIADTLSRRGVAVLRLDDRGFGASTGTFAGATSADFADDVRAAVAWLRARPDIDGNRVGLIGHSEGGLVAPLVAATDTALAAIVLIAGPAQTGRQIITFQQRYAIEQALPPAARDTAFDTAQRQLETMSAQQPWLRFFLDHDPLETARQVRRTPVLVLQGATDRQVTAEQAEVLGAAFREAGNPDVTVRVFEDVNHLLLRDPDGNPSGYATLPDRNVVKEALGELTDWLVARLD